MLEDDEVGIWGKGGVCLDMADMEERRVGHREGGGSQIVTTAIVVRSQRDGHEWGMKDAGGTPFPMVRSSTTTYHQLPVVWSSSAVVVCA